MKISDQYLDGERPLYESRDLQLSRVTIGEGESGLKESRHIEALDCSFEGMYVIWECEDVTCRNCYFAPSDRAPMWYCRDLRLFDCLIDAPKVFREIDRLTLERIKMTDGAEAFWYCRSGEISDLQIEQATYAFMHSRDLAIRNLNLVGKYTFQYAKNLEIHNAILDTKDAFWNSEDCTIYDSEIKSEYLGWYSKNLRLVRCRISGTTAYRPMRATPPIWRQRPSGWRRPARTSAGWPRWRTASAAMAWRRPSYPAAAREPPQSRPINRKLGGRVSSRTAIYDMQISLLLSLLGV